jgi:hypothetical protein
MLALKSYQIRRSATPARYENQFRITLGHFPAKEMEARYSKGVEVSIENILQQNLRELPRWATLFHVPDVLAYRDIVKAPHRFLERARARWEGDGCDQVRLFPYPKGDGRLRWFVLLTPIDLVLSRALAGSIVERTDALLPSSVFSNRLGAPPPRWRFRNPAVAHREMRARATVLATEHHGMTRTDVASYFPSINLERLRHNLVAWGCFQPVVDRLMTLLYEWEAVGIPGIPVGGDAFGVLGNAYVLPLDIRLMAQGVPYVRWVDDILVFGRTAEERWAILDLIDQELTLIDLDRSRAKTRDFTTTDAAIQSIEDEMLTSMFDGMRRRERAFSRQMLHDKFLEFIVGAEDVEPRQFRAIVRALGNRRDAFAIRWFAAQPALLNIDPIVSGDYLSEFGLDLRTGELFIDLVGSTRVVDRDLNDGRDLHLIKALSRRVWGRPEGAVFWEIALDSSRRGPVRAWAIMAAMRTPAWQVQDVIERVLEEEEPYVRRAFTLTLRRVQDD